MNFQAFPVNMVSARSARLALWGTGYPPAACSVLPPSPREKVLLPVGVLEGPSMMLREGSGWPCLALSCVYPFYLVGLPGCLEVQVAPGPWVPQTSGHATKGCWGPGGGSP